MHKLEILDPNVDVNSMQPNMCEHSEFILTQGNVRNDLSSCVICLHAPYIVCHVKRFRLNNDKSQQEFAEWQQQRMQAAENKSKAEALGMTIREYIEDVTNQVYDKELDEPRLIAKVPGMNVYLEMYGFMFNEISMDDDKVKFKAFEAELLSAIKDDMINASVWYRTQKEKREIRECGSTFEDEQLMDSWVEQLNEAEYFKRPPYCGIGFQDIDESRRAPFVPRHKFNDDESAEYKKLKEDLYPEMSLAEIRIMAVNNVAVRKNK